MANPTNESFEEVTNTSLSNSSQLKLFTILKSWDEERFLNIWRTFAVNNDIVESSSNYELYQVEDEDWWENIAYKKYGSKKFWWILCMFNGVKNPFEELEPGTEIKVLNSQYIHQLLKEIKAVGGL